MNDDIDYTLIKKSLKQNKLCFKALGSSMLPFVRNGDFVEIRSTDIDNISIGDIIFFEKDKRFFLHRLLKKNENEYITKGDNMPNFDIPINSNNILGKLTIIKRENRVIDPNSSLNKNLGKLIVIFHPLTYSIIKLFVKIYQFFKGFNLSIFPSSKNN